MHVLQSFIYLLAQISLSSFLHLGQHHGRNFLRSKCLHLATADVNLDMGLALLLGDLKENMHPYEYARYVTQVFSWRQFNP